MPSMPPSEAISFVLVGTSHPGNVGSAARALKTMGLRRLSLVDCECDPLADDARALAVGAFDLVEQAPRLQGLDLALADCQLVIGTTARRRSVPMPDWSPREAAERVVEVVARGGQVALLFGRERTGLENDELQRCHAAIHIPTAADFSSLNLASAVQVVAYELRVALLQSAQDCTDAVERLEDREPPASHAQLEAYFTHLDQALLAIDFHKGRSPDTVMRRLRRLFLRAEPSERELRILRGILADAERMARLASTSQASSG